MSLNRILGKITRSRLFVPLFLVVMTLVILSPVLIFKSTTFFTNLDNVDQFYTWYQKLAIGIHNGYLPIWNTNVFGGQLFAGELQQGVLYPLNWLWILLFGSAKGISVLALNYLVALHFWFAAFGCYLLIKQMGAKKWAALLAGLTYAFSGALAFRVASQSVIFFGLALLPYSLYFLLKYHSKVRRRIYYLVLSGIFLGLLLMVGHIQPFFHAFMALLTLELAYHIKNANKYRTLLRSIGKYFVNVLIIILSAVIISAPQLWISLPYLSHSYRVQANGLVAPGEKLSYRDFSKAFNVDIHEFSNFIDPASYPIRDGNNFYIGLASLLVIMFSIFLAKKKLRESKIWNNYSLFSVLLIVFSVLAMLGYTTWFAVVLYKLPLVYQVRQLGRYAILLDLGMVILLAAALEIFINIKISSNKKKIIFLVGLFLLINSIYLYALRHHIFSLHFAIQNALAGLAAITLSIFNSSNVRKIFISIVILLSLIANSLIFLPNINSDTETPSVYNGISSNILSLLESTNGQYRIRVTNNALPVNIGNVYKIQTMSGYGATIYAPFFHFINSSIDKNLIDDLYGVKYLVTNKLSGTDNLVYRDDNKKTFVYTRPSTLSKIFTVDKPGSLERKDYHSLDVKTVSYNDKKQVFTIYVNKPENVIISENNYKGWKATIDGKASTINTYNIDGYNIFEVIKVPSGKHTVELDFKPYLFY